LKKSVRSVDGQKSKKKKRKPPFVRGPNEENREGVKHKNEKRQGGDIRRPSIPRSKKTDIREKEEDKDHTPRKP